MIAADLLPPAPQVLPRDAALHLMAACAAEHAALKAFTAQTRPFDDDDPSLDDAERQALYAKISRAGYIVRVDRPDLARRREQMRPGDYITREEARRALGLPHRR